MMKRVEAPTLQDAYTKASVELDCSITELDFEIVQNESKGFFGLFRKNAIIIAKCKDSVVIQKKSQNLKIINSTNEKITTREQEIIIKKSSIKRPIKNLKHQQKQKNTKAKRVLLQKNPEIVLLMISSITLILIKKKLNQKKRELPLARQMILS